MGISPTHSSSDPETHAIILPNSQSPTDLYDRVELFQSGNLRVVSERAIPPELKLIQDASYAGSGEPYFIDFGPEVDLHALSSEDQAWRTRMGKAFSN